jgi:hypothetical protein
MHRSDEFLECERLVVIFGYARPEQRRVITITNGAMRQGINPITLHRCFNPRPHVGTGAQRLSLWPQSRRAYSTASTFYAKIKQEKRFRNSECGFRICLRLQNDFSGWLVGSRLLKEGQVAESEIRNPKSAFRNQIRNQFDKPHSTSNNPLHASSFSKANLPFRTISTAEDSL